MLPPPEDAPQQPDDDFAQMLRRVRAASGSDTPPPSRPRDPATRPTSRSGGYAWLIGPAVIGAVLIAGLVGLASLSTWLVSRVITQAASRDDAGARQRQFQQQRLKRFLVPVDTTITPIEAGRALHAISRAGYDGGPMQWERPVEQPIATSPCCTPAPRAAARLFDTRGNWTVAAFPAAKRGLTTEQRRFLRETAKSPPLTEFRRVARARAADLGGALWDVPADTQLSWADLPALPIPAIRSVASANIAAAILDLEAGRVASAELRLREVISVGFLVQTGARSTSEELNGSLIVSSGRGALEALYLALGRDAAANFVSAKSDPPIPPGLGRHRVRAGELEETLRRRILDTTELTGMRWQLLLGPFAYLPCTSARQAIFGPSARHRAMRQELHDALVLYPSDERRFTMITRGIPQLIDPLVGFRPRATERPAWARVAASVTRSRQLEACAWLFRR